MKASGDGALPPHVAIVTDAGSASKEQGNFIIKDAASTSMSFWSSPFRWAVDGSSEQRCYKSRWQVYCCCCWWLPGCLVLLAICADL